MARHHIFDLENQAQRKRKKVGISEGEAEQNRKMVLAVKECRKIDSGNTICMRAKSYNKRRMKLALFKHCARTEVGC